MGRAGYAVVGMVWALGASLAVAQADPEQVERELRGDEVPEGATLPEANEPTPEELEPPPLEAPPVPEPSELSEEEIVLGEGDLPDAGVTLGFVIGWGFALEPPNPWAFGIGIQGGYTADFHLHLGGRFVYFLGESGQNIFDFGLEAGYSLEASVLRFIPVLGVGIAFLTQGSVSSPEGYLAPGFQVRAVFDGFYVGMEVRGQFMFADPARMGILPMAAIGLSY
jgi:hypothetical protein